ncbi:MAG: Beta helix protein, partial [Patescibacteria group bacterium]|nr:Beta helix protein [Patescibacteria group bacterium]
MKNLFTFITKLAIASAFVFVFSATYASAATYYMSPTGSDSNSGTISSPWFSLERAWQSIAAGDTVYLRGGTYAYNDMQYLQGKNGTSGNLIKIWAYPGETPNITRSSTYKIVNGVDQDLIYFEGNYFHFKGLEISNFAQKSNETPYPAFRAGYTNHSTFENINYHHNMSAFQIRGNSTGNLILNSDFHHNKDPYGDAPYDGADGLGITFNYDTNSVNTIRGSRAYWNADDGFDTWENSGHVIIENSWAFYNGYLPDTFTEAGNGTAFKLGSISNSSTQTKRTLKNNLAYKNRFAGFVENNAGVKMEMYNNTSVNAGYSGYWVGAWSGNGNVTIAKNNLDYLGTNAPGPWNSASTVTNNSWQNNITVTNADFASMDDSQLLRARKSDNSLPDITFLTPVASSDLVNKGTPISGMSYVGSAPDIGAFEYGGTTTTTSTTFTVGQRVQVNATSLNVRGTASATGTLLGTQTSGALGTVTAGPTSADGYVWWNVNYDSGVDGWSAENYLTSYTAPTPDTTAPTVPTNLAGTATSSSQINLSWTASTDAVGVTGYKIYRNGTQIATSTTNS